MRNVSATVLQVIAVVGLVVAGWLWCVVAGVVMTSLAVGLVGYVIDPTR